MGVILVIFSFLGLIHLINWLLTKGVIFVMLQLFRVDWSHNFWAVYLLIILLGILFRGVVTVNTKEK